MASPIPVPPVSRRVVKKASNIFSWLASDIGSPSLLTVILTVAASSTASSRTFLALWRMALSVRCDSTISAFSLEMPTLDAPPAELEASDWRPFREVLAGSRAHLMIGHVILTAVDPDRAASHSRLVVDGIVRKK